ncbi:MAG TPA: ATP-binding protein [Accumulibacter sp.]|nr:ATP-binding protein [Accumulibacter sp.]
MKWLSFFFGEAGVFTRSRRGALFSFVLTLLLAAGLIWRQEDSRLREARNLADNLATEYASTLQNTLERSLGSTYALAAVLHNYKGLIPDFEATASALLRSYPGVIAFQLAPGGIVSQVAPLRGNEGMVGYNLLHDTLRNRDAFLARKTRQLTVSGPINLAHGGTAIVGRLPVFLDDGLGANPFWGFVVVLVAFPKTLGTTQLAELRERGYDYELSRRDTGSLENVVIGASTPQPLRQPVERSLRLANATWILKVAPVSGWYEESTLYRKAFIGLLCSLFIAWLTAFQMNLVARIKEHERTLKLQAEQRTDDLQRFAELSSRHLQEPARRLSSYAERLQQQLAGRLRDGEVQLSLNLITQQATRLQHLLRDVESYLVADQPIGEIVICDTGEIVNNIVRKLNPALLELGIRIRVGTLPPALIDAARLAEVFTVALDNAVLHGRSEHALQIIIDGDRRGNDVYYRVSDNGPGVAEENRERVFRIFERLSTEGEGTGVGLAILRRICESVGGSAWLEETPGGGCRLVIKLPAVESPMALTSTKI